MLIGILLILTGLLVFLYPPLLAFIVGTMLILQGVLCIVLAINYRRTGATHRLRTVDVLLRF